MLEFKGMDKKKFIANTMVITWGILIFVFSSQEGSTSGQLSGVIARELYAFLQVIPFFSRIIPFEFFHFLLRKSAHFFKYFIFGLLVINAFKNYRPLNLNDFVPISLFGMMVAFIDEGLQYFIPGRYFSLIDIMIDFSGFVIGGLLMYYFHLRKTNKTFEQA